MKLLYRAILSLNLSLTVSNTVGYYLFNLGATSYWICTIGLGLVLAPLSYRTLSKVFGDRIILIDTTTLKKELDTILKKKMDEHNEKE